MEKGGLIIYDSSVVEDPPEVDPTIRLVAVPCSDIALDLGSIKVKNLVALGALQTASEMFPAESFLAAMRKRFGNRDSLLALNEKAFEAGAQAARS